MAVTLPIAFALAWVLARGRFPGKVLLDALVHLPLVLPPVVTGWLLLIAFGAERADRAAGCETGSASRAVPLDRRGDRRRR